MAQQTALEQFIEWIDSDCTPMDCVMKAKELLKVEKQQHSETWHDSRENTCIPFEHYYTETFGNNTKKL